MSKVRKSMGAIKSPVSKSTFISGNTPKSVPAPSRKGRDKNSKTITPIGVKTRQRASLLPERKQIRSSSEGDDDDESDDGSLNSFNEDDIEKMLMGSEGESEEEDAEPIVEKNVKKAVKSPVKNLATKVTEKKEAVKTPKKENVKTPKKENVKTPKKETVKTPKKEQNEVKKVVNASNKKVTNGATVPAPFAASFASRDNRTLFLKRLPRNVTESDIRALSKDITSVRIRTIFRKGQSVNAGLAYAEFKDEATADKNYKLLQGKKLADKEIFVDYCGSKSKHIPEESKKSSEVDPTKLYVSGFGPNTTEQDLRKIFPTAIAVNLPVAKRSGGGHLLGFGFLFFKSAEDAATVHNSQKPKQLNGQNLVVIYARKTTALGKRKKESTKKPAKAQKVEDLEDEVEEDEDSGNEMEEEDGGDDEDDSSDEDDE